MRLHAQQGLEVPVGRPNPGGIVPVDDDGKEGADDHQTVRRVELDGLPEAPAGRAGGGSGGRRRRRRRRRGSSSAAAVVLIPRAQGMDRRGRRGEPDLLPACGPGGHRRRRRRRCGRRRCFLFLLGGTAAGDPDVLVAAAAVVVKRPLVVDVRFLALALSEDVVDDVGLSGVQKPDGKNVVAVVVLTAAGRRRRRVVVTVVLLFFRFRQLLLLEVDEKLLGVIRGPHAHTDGGRRIAQRLLDFFQLGNGPHDSTPACDSS
mmetsp:Transcript_1470/g.3686  ORF Transcript_1470/g.3686 Transcript_1470/m.3686 type:complete len:260 (-) Transcript_1470:182-961(-)